MSLNPISLIEDAWNSGTIRAIALKYVKNGLLSGGVVLMAWLQSKGLSHDDSANLVAHLAAGAMILLPFVMDHLDVRKVDAQVKTVAAVAADNAVNPTDDKKAALARLVGGSA